MDADFSQQAVSVTMVTRQRVMSFSLISAWHGGSIFGGLEVLVCHPQHFSVSHKEIILILLKEHYGFLPL